MEEMAFLIVMNFVNLNYYNVNVFVPFLTKAFHLLVAKEYNCEIMVSILPYFRE